MPYEAACFPGSVPPPLLLTRPLLLIAQTMRYLAILPQDRGSDGKHDWSTLNFCFDEQVSPVRGTPPSADACFPVQSTHPLTCCHPCASPHRSGTLASRRLAGMRFSASIRRRPTRRAAASFPGKRAKSRLDGHSVWVIIEIVDLYGTSPILLMLPQYGSALLKSTTIATGQAGAMHRGRCFVCRI